MVKPVVVQSRRPFSETIAALTHAITDAGSTLFAAVDQSVAAEMAGLTLRPTTLLLFGNPKGGTPLMEAFPLLALELPLKLLVWDDGAGVNVAYIPMSVVAERYGLNSQDALLIPLDRALATLSASVT